VLEQIRVLGRKTECILGLNLREAEQVSQVLGIGEAPRDSAAGVEDASKRIREALGIHGVVVHAIKFAGAWVGGDHAGIVGPFCPSPKLSTGAGDHFNGGFCAGLLAGLTVLDALYAGVGTSGWYVRNARSPKLDDVAAFLKTWGSGQPID